MSKIKYLKEDKKAKSKSFFFTKESKVFNLKHVKFLEKYYYKEKKDIRICLHTSKKSKHHDMIILQQKKTGIDVSRNPSCYLPGWSKEYGNFVLKFLSNENVRIKKKQYNSV